MIYTSDHGFMFQSHGAWGKRLPWEESIRVPFIIRWPGHIAPGSVSNALFGTIDHMPTLLGLAGIQIPDSCLGKDFSPLMLGQQTAIPSSQFIMGMSSPERMFRGVRTDRYTLAIWPPWQAYRNLLLDNLRDPYQRANRYDDAGYAGVQSQLTEELARFLEAADDPFADIETRGYLPSVRRA